MPHKPEETQIDSDGVTVWVNVRGVCLGRFGRQGIDIHHDLEGQEKHGVECLMCTHGPVTKEDWPRFIEGMFEHHGIIVPEEHRPHRFKEPA